MKKTYVFLLALIVSCPMVLGAQTTYQVATNNGNWNNPGTWSPPGIPGPGDFVNINSNVQIWDSHEIAGFELGNRANIFFKGTNNPSLTVTANSTWSSGSFIGGNGANGGNDVNNTLLFTETSVLTIIEDPEIRFHHLYEGTNMINRGTVILQGTANIGGRGLSVLHNEGLFDIQSDADFDGESFSGAIFINTGTFRKSGGTDVTNMTAWWKFHNDGGILEVQSGRFEPVAGGSLINGTYVVSEGATLAFAGGIWKVSGTLTGSPAGTFGLINGDFDTDSTAVTLNIKGTGFQQIRGVIRGGGTLTVAEGSLYVLPGTDYASLRGGTTLRNQGTIEMGGTFAFGIVGNSVVKNESLWDVKSDADFGGGTGSGGIFVNTGTFRKSGGTEVTIMNNWWKFHNQGGTIEVQSGSFEPTCGGNLTNGSYNASEGATLAFDGGTWILSGTLTGSPAGTFGLKDGNFDTDGAAATLNITGTGFQHLRGVITGGGTLTIANGSLYVLPGTNYASLRGGTTLKNQGTIEMSGTYAFGIVGNSVVENESLWDVKSDADFSGGTGSGGIFVNTGTFRKSGGTDISNIDGWWTFRNNSGGVIDAASGTFDFNKLENVENSTIQGNGAVAVKTNFINNGIVSPGSSPGILSWSTNFSPSETSVLKIELNGLTPDTGHDQLAVTGNVALNGSIEVSLVNGYTPAKGDSFVVLTSTKAITNDFAALNAPQGLHLHAQVNANNVTLVVDSVSSSLSIEEGPAIPGFELSQNWPNPFSLTTTIQFEIPDKVTFREEKVTLKIYDLHGKQVATLIDKNLLPGKHEIVFDGSHLPEGLYLCRLRQGNAIRTLKMVLVK